jgi:hypothetical protein
MKQLAVIAGALVVGVMLAFAVSTTPPVTADAEAHVPYHCGHYNILNWSNGHHTKVTYIRHWWTVAGGYQNNHYHRVFADHQPGYWQSNWTWQCGSGGRHY